MDLQVTAAKLTGDVERDVKSLSNHVFQLEEQLRYQLRNLDVTNFNDLGLARYENGRLQIYTEQLNIQTDKLRVELGKETDDIYAEIEATAQGLDAKITGLEGQYTTLQATADGLSTRVGNVEGSYSSLNQTVDGIQSTVGSHTTTLNSHTNTLNSHTSSINSQSSSISNLQSQITQTNSKISAVVSAVDDSSGNVTAASIVAAINSAGSSVKISADHITLTGVVTVDDLAGNGTVEINAGNIVAGGTISGVALESTGGYYWKRVTIANGQIELYSGGLYDDSYGEILLYSSSTLHLESYSGNVRIYPGTTAYWEFRSSGIFWCDSSGNVMNSVTLNGS